MRKPSEHTIDLYNQLVEQQNKVRKKLYRVHKHAEETLGAGRLPSLVVPKSARKIRKNYFEVDRASLQRRSKAFWNAYNEKKELFGQGLRSYLARTVKNGYMDLWRDQILFMSGESPEGVASRFTREQIDTSFMGEFMEVYNKLVSLSPEVFLAMLYSGRIIQFKFIYSEMIGQGNKEYSWLDQQLDLLKETSKMKEQMRILDEMKDETGKHQQKTIKKAEKLKERAERG